MVHCSDDNEPRKNGVKCTIAIILFDVGIILIVALTYVLAAVTCTL